MADHRQDAFAERTRQLYEEAFGSPLADEDLVMALEAATNAAKKNFLLAYFQQAGMSLRDLAALSTRLSAELAPAVPAANRAEAVGAERAALSPHSKFKRADNDEWMFNFDD